MTLKPPEFDRLVLRRPPLTLVVSQLRFTSILSILQQEFIAPFQEDIRQLYPVLEQQQRLQVQVPPVPGPPLVETSTLWRFLSPDRRWIAALAPDFLALETEAYTTFAEFATRFETLLSALVNRFHPSQQVRMGLRYVNEFRSPTRRPEPRDWRGYIREELLGALVSDAFGAVGGGARQDIRVRQDDGWFVLRLQLAGQEQDGPSGVTLDFDYYDEEQRQLDPVDILQKLGRYNDLTYRMFRWAVLDPLLEELEPEHENR